VAHRDAAGPTAATGLYAVSGSSLPITGYLVAVSRLHLTTQLDTALSTTAATQPRLEDTTTFAVLQRGFIQRACEPRSTPAGTFCSVGPRIDVVDGE
jgi:hypothetical protein